MATAREVRAAVRAQLAEQVKARQDAALAVAAAWAKVGKARDKLTAAERDAAEVVASATAELTITDLAALAGIPEAELRRLARSAKTATQTAGDGVATAAEQPAAGRQADPPPGPDNPAAEEPAVKEPAALGA